METRHSVPTTVISRPLIEAILAYVVFCALSFLSHFIPPLFLLVVIGGIAFPVLWAWRARDWAAIGFRRRNLGPAFLWGTAVGLVGVLIILLEAQRHPYPAPILPGLQVAIGIPIWLLILSPFQEFFFRGWLQPRLDSALGRWAGLVITTLGFTAWHFLSPFQGAPGAVLDIASASSVLIMLGMGTAFGYIFQRTNNIAAPWLAHVLMGIALVVVGGMTFIQYN